MLIAMFKVMLQEELGFINLKYPKPIVSSKYITTVDQPKLFTMPESCAISDKLKPSASEMKSANNIACNASDAPAFLADQVRIPKPVAAAPKS